MELAMRDVSFVISDELNSFVNCKGHCVLSNARFHQQHKNFNSALPKHTKYLLLMQRYCIGNHKIEDKMTNIDLCFQRIETGCLCFAITVSLQLNIHMVGGANICC